MGPAVGPARHGADGRHHVQGEEGPGCGDL